MTKLDRLYKLSQGSDTAIWACDEILRQDERIAELENQWISVEDRLPDENKNVIVFANDIVSSFVETACYYVCPEYLHGGWSEENGDPYEPIITHWMNLPEPPKEQEQTNGMNAVWKLAREQGK